LKRFADITPDRITQEDRESADIEGEIAGNTLPPGAIGLRNTSGEGRIPLWYGLILQAAAGWLTPRYTRSDPERDDVPEISRFFGIVIKMFLLTMRRHTSMPSTPSMRRSSRSRRSTSFRNQ